MTKFSPFKDEVKPGVASTPEDLSFKVVTVLDLIKLGGQIRLSHPRMKDALAANRIHLR